MARVRKGLSPWLLALLLTGCGDGAAGDGSTWVVEEGSGLFSGLTGCTCTLRDALTSFTDADELLLACDSERSGTRRVVVSLPLSPTNHLRGAVAGTATFNDVYDVGATAIVELGHAVEARIHDQTELDSARHPYRVVHIHRLAVAGGQACSFLDSGDCAEVPAGRLSGYHGYCDALSFDHEHNRAPRPE